MGERGPKSAKDQATRTPATVSAISDHKPPEPPTHLGDAETETWREIVGALPHDWFPRETHGILAAYCSHVKEADFISSLIEPHQQSALEDLDVKLYDKLLRMRSRETSMMIHLARTMRLTQQSTIDPKAGGRQKAKRGGSIPPWEYKPAWID